jgi:cytochrome b subunit of formate dehydrogenase
MNEPPAPVPGARSEPVEPAEPGEAAQATEPAEATESAQATQATEPVEVVKPAEPAEATARPARRPLVKRHHWIVRVTHWANVVLLFGMIASGLQIYGAFTHFGPRGHKFYPNPLDGKALSHTVTLGGWLAGGLNWHFALAWPFVLCGLVYVLYLATTGEWRSLLFLPRDVPRAWQMQLYYLGLRKEHPPQGKHNALQKFSYTGITLL